MIFTSFNAAHARAAFSRFYEPGTDINNGQNLFFMTNLKTFSTIRATISLVSDLQDGKASNQCIKCPDGTQMAAPAIEGHCKVE